MSAVAALSGAVKRLQSAMISRFAHITRIRMRQIGVRVSIRQSKNYLIYISHISV